MRWLLALTFFALIALAVSLPAGNDKATNEDVEKPVSLLDVADTGDNHSNAADRNARFLYGGLGWGGGWGGGYGWGRRWGWGGGGWGWRRPWGWGGGWGWG